jgi:hypothetical protein
MQRLLATSVLGFALAVIAMPAGAQTLFTDGFEVADGHTAGTDILGTNGWNQGFLSGNVSTNHQVGASAPGLSGLVGDGNAVAGDNGSFTQITNAAGLAGGLSSGQEVVLSWQMLVNSGGTTTQGGLNFLGGRAGMNVVTGGTEINVADMPDTDTRHALPGGGAEEVLDLAIIINETTTTFMMNGNVLQVSASTAGGFNGLNSIAWGCGNDAGVECGIVDNIVVAIPEPASLGLLALGGIALLRRRRA